MNDSAQSSWSAVAGVALLTTAIGSIFFVGGPLESRRPDRDAIHALSSQPETVPARLWQDPLGVIQGDWSRIVSHVAAKNSLPTQNALPSPMNRLWRDALEELPGPQLWLFAVVSGSPYADDVEHRRRDRYAVVTALTRNDFQPKQAARIGYVVGPSFTPRQLPEYKLPPRAHVWASSPELAKATSGQARRSRCPRGTDTATRSEVAAKCTILVGFERYEYDGAGPNRFKSAVVFWLNGDDFKTDPLQRVAGLVTAIRPPEPPVDSTLGSLVTPVMLGPPTSGMLKDMVVDDSRRESALAAAASFVAHARAFDSIRELLTADWPNGYRRWRRHDQHPRASYTRLGEVESTVADLNILSTRSTVPLDILFDGDAPVVEAGVASALGVSTFRSVVARDDVVLLEILQELAGRGACRNEDVVGLAIVAERDSVYGRRFDDIVEARQEAGSLNCWFAIREYGYLKGVDGESSRREPAEQVGSPDSGPAVFHPLLRSVDGAEPAHGDAQLDYVRRIADQITRDHARGRLGDRVVVGVLGADIYDKQLVLQALRESLPGATYFTTDLDARLHQPEAKRSTRNLIVGSAHGLTVDGHAGAVFRDSYQTATYLATDLALNAMPPVAAGSEFSPCLDLDTHRGCNPVPRLFEIGLNRTVDISPAAAGPWGWSQSAAALALLAPLLGLIVVVLAMAFRLHRSVPPVARRRAYFQVSVLAGATTVALVGLMWFAARPGLEPTDYLEGVSSIPALLLDATTFVYAVSIVLIVRARVVEADDALDGAFVDAEQRRNGRCDGKDCALAPLLRDTPKDCQQSLSDVLCGHHDRGSPIRQASWVAVRFAGAAIAVLAVAWFDDDGPLLTRGMATLSTVSHEIMLLAVVGCVCMWSFYVNLDRALIRELVRSRLPDLAARVKAVDDAGALSDFPRHRGYVMDLVVERTRTVGSSIVLPFLLFPLMMLSHSTVFEGWAWTRADLALYAAIAAYVLIQALGYQREATDARGLVLDQLRTHRLVATGRAQRRITKRVIANTLSIHAGAFSPWTRHPILQSLAIPLGGLALVALLSFLF